MNYLPLVVFVLVAAAMILFVSRARRRQADTQLAAAERIEPGTEVMTTSGLHGTVVARHDDGTVTLRIAPEVEVVWEVAALRDLAALPERFRSRGTDLAGPARPSLETTTDQQPD